ncbi:hypothetical protein BBJ28_00006038 [Nothophytophthora sp. Chile5]|nr:hypothetical protein BBJ28_00006038 [Nothophytophthora sp. Chile5]
MATSLSTKQPWTESEVTLLVRAWRQVDTKGPSLQRRWAAGRFEEKMHTLLSQRSRFLHSPASIHRQQMRILEFGKLVHRFNEARRAEGGRLWFDLTTEERERGKPLAMTRLALVTTLNRESFDTLVEMKVLMERGLESPAALDSQQAQDQAPDTSLRPQCSQSSPPAAIAHSAVLNQGNEASRERPRVRSHKALQQERSPASGRPSGGQVKQGAARKRHPKAKHRECKDLLVSLMEQQNKRFQRAVQNLRADIEGDIQRSAEMLRSVASDRFEGPGSSGDANFVARLLETKQRQVRGRFDRLQEAREREEASNWAHVEQCFGSQRD